MADKEEGLDFLNREEYEEMMKKKGMIDQNQKKIVDHSGYLSTPVRMTTRSKAIHIAEEFPLSKKRKTGGYNCPSCHKFYKTERWLNAHSQKTSQTSWG